MASENYNMNHEKRGKALVINMQTFDAPNPFKLKERVWSVKDVENLQHTLEYLEFDFKLCQNFTKSQIEQEIKEMASSVDHSNSDCFLCVVMSHGNEDKIVTSDNKEMSFEEIMAPIKQCSSLSDKPKLFFFQACRGDNEIKKHIKTRPDSSESKSSGQDISDNHPKDNKSISASSNTNKKTEISTKTDLLVFNATLPDYYAFGTEKDGTFFIKSVCEVLNDAYKNVPNNLPLSQMITKINQKVEKTEIQVADPIYRLKKEVYFSPKNVSVAIFILFILFYLNKRRNLVSYFLEKIQIFRQIF
jgi:caspase 7